MRRRGSIHGLVTMGNQVAGEEGTGMMMAILPSFRPGTAQDIAKRTGPPAYNGRVGKELQGFDISVFGFFSIVPGWNPLERATISRSRKLKRPSPPFAMA